MNEIGILSVCLKAVGVAHFFNVPATLVAPKLLGWKEDFAKLQVINRTIVFVLGIGMQITIMGLGIVTIISSNELLAGGRIALAFNGFMILFWLYRALVQYIVYPRVWPRNLWAMHLGLTCLLTFLTTGYVAAFVVCWMNRPL